MSGNYIDSEATDYSEEDIEVSVFIHKLENDNFNKISNEVEETITILLDGYTALKP